MSGIQQLSPFLMFENGRAEEALNFYVDLFGGEVVLIDRYGPENPAMDGRVRLATFAIAGTQVNIIDSPVPHGFRFTPALSLFYRATSQAELDRLWTGLLGGGGHALMPLGDYGFGPFGWLNDRYGVSWQLNLAAADAGVGDGADGGAADGGMAGNGMAERTA
ncbi:VOC family protein [Brevibacterium casei]|uniref:VOC family protein n=1 Tax=Brevibacterium casei TaxID=33889 RepID=A0A269ZHD7_9MICO|nr:VOC family protein [Brevibacterium casei]MCT1548944.1 VOC family protein [Brevibacterium casei]MCT1561061.1 VOC family protein [Brevibacterium casei]MCT2207446.1 VOC family protein [Brevibacterium casei]PAK97204.1 hypothetical protein B8X04_01085 [Brevibacterium casei]QPS34751.1 VOC family protein [Brevibacterium casei]